MVVQILSHPQSEAPSHAQSIIQGLLMQNSIKLEDKKDIGKN
jgi:hypothetical protein